MASVKKRGVAFAAGGLVLVLAFAAVGVPEIRMRAQLVGMKLGGSLPGIGWPLALRILRPGHPYSIEQLVEIGNPYLAIRNPHSSARDVIGGRELFRRHCAACHGPHAGAGTHVDLTDAEFANGGSDWALYRSIAEGVAGTEMRAWDLPEPAVWQLVAFIRAQAFDGEAGVHAGADLWEGRRAPGPVRSEQLLKAEVDNESWLSYSRTYSSHRYSPLAQIRPDNVSRLALRWAYQMPTAERKVESSPIVVDDAMFVTEPPDKVVALALDTGEPIWSYQRPVPEGLSLCCGRVNRGAAILEDKLYVGTLDAHLVALDARTGELVWEVELADHEQGFSITHAPLALDGLIVVGVSGGEFGIRGFLDAYDADTGERAWRFSTIPGPAEPGHDSWSGDSWKRGGGPTWMTGSYDPDLGLVYWGVGNPSPVYQGDVRMGDNLYTNSVIALDTETGRLQWYFQFTPHDEHDWDANQVPVLVDAELAGAPRKLMLFANKNGFYYVLDRVNGEFVAARAFARQTWAEGIDATGRPRIKPGSRARAEGTVVFPSEAGATNWWPPSFSPRTHLFYLGVLERGKVFHKLEEPASYEEGARFLGGSSRVLRSDGPPRFFVRALAPETGRVVWEFELPRVAQGSMGGVLSTGGGLLFVAGHRWLFALDAGTGEELWRINTGARIEAAPITYEYRGEQRVTLAAGRSVLTFAVPEAVGGRVRPTEQITRSAR